MPDSLNGAFQLAPALSASASADRLALLWIAIRNYCVGVERRGFCYAKDLVELGFDHDFVLGHWSLIREQGEDLVASRRRRAGVEPHARFFRKSPS